MTAILKQRTAPMRKRVRIPATRQPRRIGYGRVSTADQNPQVQAAALEAAGCDVIHTERISSRISHRPQLEAALGSLRAGDTLVVSRLDRLARSLAELVAIGADLQARGVALQVLEQGIDTGTATGRLMFGMLGAVAEFERELIAERTLESIRHRRARGDDFGGRRLSYTPAQAAMVWRLRDEGQSLRDVAAAVGLSRSVVHRITQQARPAEA